ncbi:MAG TPA: nucleotidyltransferase domain-containing protein [Firmicutes bacterium]|nr:nucleotidyltransferase domain-containing protein [Bacillota bacterium]
MDRETVLSILSRFRQALAARNIRQTRIVLFGSCANATATEASDIDVVVISPDFEGKSFWDRIEILSDAIYEVFAPIEAVALTPEEWDRGDSVIVEYARRGETIPES